MALFGGSRDISLFKNISKELINDIIQTEVAYYKFALEQIKNDILTQGKDRTDLRIPGIKSFKFKYETLKRK